MAWGEDAAERHEQAETSSCLRPEGARPELEPIKDRRDFEIRVRGLISHISNNLLLADSKDRKVREAGEKWLANFRTEMDQLVLMRSAQILDEAEERRRDVMARFSNGVHYPSSGGAHVTERCTSQCPGETPAEIVLDDDERRGD